MITTSSHPLQSSEWAAFREEWGNEVVKTPYGYITLHKLPLAPYKIGMFIKGPTPTQDMLTYLRKFAKDNRLIFIKIESNTTKDSLGTEYGKIINLLKRNGAINGKTLFTPTTFWINLTPAEKDIFDKFLPKTRYNIRLAEKRGVIVKENNSDEAFNRYLELTDETTKRQGFYAHTHRYHELMWNHLHKQMVANNKKPIAHLIEATYMGNVITTWILFSYDKFLYYPYGASSDKHKEVMANNLMMWEAIKFGKKIGCTTFDLWGREPGKGFTKFKEGYNPKVVEFLGTWDLVTSPLYYIYRILETVRWQVLRKASILIRRK